MSYVELLKLSYGDEDGYIEEHRRRLNSADTIKLNFQIKENQAFFVQNAEAANIVFQILKADKKTSMLSNQLPTSALDRFSKMCLIDEIVLTNKIEGVHSTRREIADILNELEERVDYKTKSRKRFWGLVNQYAKLKTELYVPVETCKDIRQLYDELVLPEVIEENPGNAPDGELFRKEATSVYTPTEKEIHRGAYPESKIIEQMEAALSFLNDESIELLYRVAVFHYLFEHIHPFYDGNGRIGRYIISNFLAKELNPLLSYRISKTITENIKRYYDAFNVCNNPRNMGDLTPFLLMMLNMINDSALELEETMQSGYQRLNVYESMTAQLPNGSHERTRKTYCTLIQAALFSEQGVSASELVCLLESSYTTVKKVLAFIDTNQLLIKNKIGREHYYLLDLDELDRRRCGKL